MSSSGDAVDIIDDSDNEAIASCISGTICTASLSSPRQTQQPVGFNYTAEIVNTTTGDVLAQSTTQIDWDPPIAIWASSYNEPSSAGWPLIYANVYIPWSDTASDTDIVEICGTLIRGGCMGEALRLLRTK